jgi:hypothetical protein
MKPHSFIELPFIGSLRICMRPALPEQPTANASSHLLIVVKPIDSIQIRNLISQRTSIQRLSVFDKTPSANVILAISGMPLVEDHLIIHVLPLPIIEMIQLNKINALRKGTIARDSPRDSNTKQ